jgi:acetyl esterase/lipase
VDLTSRLDAQHMSVYRAMPGDLLSRLAVDIPAVRARSAELAQAVARPPWPDAVTVEDRWAPSGDGHDVMVRLYHPTHAPSPSPTLYWVHGGGMVMGSVAQNDDMCAAFADRLGIVVASVEYRLAPEHPYPTPLVD